MRDLAADREEPLSSPREIWFGPAMMREPNRFAPALSGMTATRILCAAGAVLLLAACQQGDAAPGQATDARLPDADSSEAYNGIGEDETVRFTGTEPFWGGQVGGGSLTYTTPDNPDGTAIMVERFAGRGGLSFTGMLEGADFEMMVTPLECSDGMSDRTYPFTVTLKLGDELRNGCGWTERQPFEGPERP
jgi:uncharacterized membrane protein